MLFLSSSLWLQLAPALLLLGDVSSELNPDSPTGRHPSDIDDVEGPHQQVQVPDAGGLEQLGPVHHGDGDAQSGPDVRRHLLVAAALTPPLLVQSRQEVTDRLPAGQTRSGKMRPGPGPGPGHTSLLSSSLMH